MPVEDAQRVGSQCGYQKSAYYQSKEKKTKSSTERRPENTLPEKTGMKCIHGEQPLVLTNRRSDQGLHCKFRRRWRRKHIHYGRRGGTMEGQTRMVIAAVIVVYMAAKMFGKEFAKAHFVPMLDLFVVMVFMKMGDQGGQFRQLLQDRSKPLDYKYQANK